MPTHLAGCLGTELPGCTYSRTWLGSLGLAKHGVARVAQLGAAIPWVGHVPRYWVAGAGGDRDKHWVLACGRLSAHPAHVCCSRVRPQPLLPGPQMVARKRWPVPPPSVRHHASLAPWPHSPAGTRGWEQLGHPEPGRRAPSAWPPMGHTAPPGSHLALAKG